MAAARTNTSSELDPLAQLDPFDFLMDAHFQLVRAVEARASTEPARVATALGVVVAHDRALRAIAHAYIAGDRTFEGVAAPDPGTATVEDALSSRNELFEVIGTSVEMLAFDVQLRLPWVGLDTWRGHLIGLAMLGGALAYALHEGDPLPGTSDAGGD